MKSLADQKAEQQAKLDKAKAIKAAQEKYAAACAEYHETLATFEPVDLKNLAAYNPFAEQIIHSDANQASSAGLLARILRLEAKADFRDEPPALEDFLSSE